MADPLLGMRVLVLDDEPLNVELLEAILCDAGFTNVETATDARLTLQSARRDPPDLVLLDLHMPAIDGFEVMARLGSEIRTGNGPPILVLTADGTPATKHRALGAGARDLVLKPFDQVEVLLRVRNLLTVRLFEKERAAANERLEHAVRLRTADLEASRLELLDRLALVAEFRDDDTNQHALRVGRCAQTIATALALPPEIVEMLDRAAALHDIGKIGIPDSILLKPGPLTDNEFAVMKKHTEIGAQMLAGSSFAVLQLARSIALTHHERFDGTGYPAGLAGEQIPIEGRITAVADVYDALTSERAYRPAFERNVALEMMLEQRGRQFDPCALDALLDHAADPPTSHTPRTSRAAQPRGGASLQPIIDLQTGAVVLQRVTVTGADGNRNPNPASFSDPDGELVQAALIAAGDGTGPGRTPLLIRADARALSNGSLHRVLVDRVPADTPTALSLCRVPSDGAAELGPRIRELRQLGYLIAIEDFAAHAGSLELAASCRVEYLIPSLNVWSRIQVSGPQQLLLWALADLADRLGARLLVGPVADPADLEALRTIGRSTAFGTIFQADALTPPSASLKPPVPIEAAHVSRQHHTAPRSR